MKLSVKLLIGTQCLLAAAFLTFSVLVVQNAKAKVTEEAVSYVLSEEENLNSTIEEAWRKISFTRGSQPFKTALNYSMMLGSKP